MKSYTLGVYEKAMPAHLSWREKMETAVEAGYDFIEISIDETPQKLKRLDMKEAERTEFLMLMRELRMPVQTMCLSGHRKYPLGSQQPEIRKQGMEIMEKALKLAEDLGIRIVQLAGYDVYYEKGNTQTRQYFLENLQKAVDMAAARGIMLGFETMETEFMNTVEKAGQYVAQMNSPYLNIYPDLGNITNAAVLYGTTVNGDLECGKGKLLAMHLKETVPGKFREITYGDGHVKFEEGIGKAWELGIRRFVTEFWYTGSPQWKEDLAIAVKTMSQILDKQLKTA